jgi:RimJ/RimL family protein N-acetyltransferase
VTRCGVLSDHFPVLGLQLTTPRLQLRPPRADELAELADVAATGIHDPRVMPFTVPWTDEPPDKIARWVIQNYWTDLGSLRPCRWTLQFAVVLAGAVIGMQELRASDFAVRREVSTASWLARDHHGQGIGVEMRAAVLHLAFAELGAQEAVSEAFEDSTSSLAVSRKLGYQPDGIQRDLARGSSLSRDGCASPVPPGTCMQPSR